ncbi:MAG: hypothetical protein V1644_01405 [Candidatus Micrarchaeota archaeon]
MQLTNGYILIAICTAMAFFLNITWLFYLMLLVLVLLMVGESLSAKPTRHHHHAGHGHAKQPAKTAAPNFLDGLLSSLVVDQYKAGKEHKEHEKIEEKILEEIAEAHEHEDNVSKEHLEAQLGKLESKISENTKSGNEKVVKELKKQRDSIKKKLDGM